MNDPMTATYSVLAQEVRGLSGTPRCRHWGLHGKAPEKRDRHCRRRELGFTARSADAMRRTGMLSFYVGTSVVLQARHDATDGG